MFHSVFMFLYFLYGVCVFIFSVDLLFRDVSVLSFNGLQAQNTLHRSGFQTLPASNAEQMEKTDFRPQSERRNRIKKWSANEKLYLSLIYALTNRRCTGGEEAESNQLMLFIW